MELAVILLIVTIALLLLVLWRLSLRYGEAHAVLKLKDERIEQLLLEQNNVEEIAQKVMAANSTKASEHTTKIG